MRVLITGHNGYLGAVMVPVLKAAGHEVVGLDTYYFEGCDFEETADAPQIIRKDVRDLTVQDLKGFDAIAHLAALSNDPMGDLQADWTYDINHLGSVQLARLAKEAGVERFLFSSSCSMYGASGHDVLSEEAHLAPLTAYAISKVRTEEDLNKLADINFSPVYLRNATAYGLSPKFRVDLVLNNLSCWAYTTKKIKIMSDGTPWRPLVHTEDIALAFAAVLAAPRELIHNEAFNVGVNGENYQVRELAEIVKAVIPDCEVEFAGEGGADPRDYQVDFTKIAQTLPEFKPKWNARLGTEAMYSAFQKVKLTLDDFQGRKYIRLKQLKHLIDDGYLDTSLRWRNVKENNEQAF